MAVSGLYPLYIKQYSWLNVFLYVDFILSIYLVSLSIYLDEQVHKVCDLDPVLGVVAAEYP